MATNKKKEKKQRKYYKELRASILNDEYCVYIFLGDAARACKVIKKWHPDICNPEIFASSRGYSFMNADTNPSLWVGLELDDPHFFATLAHEATHAIDHIFDMVREREAPEIYAHSVAAVVAKVEAWVKTKTRKEKT